MGIEGALVVATLKVQKSPPKIDNIEKILG